MGITGFACRSIAADEIEVVAWACLATKQNLVNARSFEADEESTTSLQSTAVDRRLSSSGDGTACERE